MYPVIEINNGTYIMEKVIEFSKSMSSILYDDMTLKTFPSYFEFILRRGTQLIILQISVKSIYPSC